MNLLQENELPDLPMVYLHQTSVRSQLIYSAALLFIVCTLASLPFISINLTVKSKGALQTAFGKQPIFAPTNGHLTSFRLKENQRVSHGSMMFTIDNFATEQEFSSVCSNIKRLDLLARDVHALLKSATNISPKTEYYKSYLKKHLAQLQNIDNEIAQVKRDYDRYEKLYQLKVITTSEFELRRLNYEKVLATKELITTTIKQQWQTEANKYEIESKELAKNMRILVKQRDNYSVKSTVNGHVTNVLPVQSGDWVSANQQLAEVSIDSTLFAFCYIKPSSISHVKKGQTVRLQIDAFSYHQWGTLLGSVIDISEDVILLDNESYFKVTCELSQKYLVLNGHIGLLKKGMTFTAGFFIAPRTLFQLMSDKTQDWLNL